MNGSGNVKTEKSCANKTKCNTVQIKTDFFSSFNRIYKSCSSKLKCVTAKTAAMANTHEIARTPLTFVRVATLYAEL